MNKSVSFQKFQSGFSFLITLLCFEAFGEFGESMKSWLCQNPERRAVNNVNAHKKTLK